MFKENNIKEYPNIYNLSLLFLMGYEAKEVILSEKKDQMQVVVRGTSPELLRRIYIVNMYSSKTSQGTVEFTELVLDEFNNHLKNAVKANAYKQNTFMALESFKSLHNDNIADRIMSGAFAHHVERTFQKINNAEKDVEFELSKVQGTTSLANAFDKFAKAQPINKYEDEIVSILPSGEDIVSKVTAIIKGEDLAQVKTL